jgi:hypothetical protein
MRKRIYLIAVLICGLTIVKAQTNLGVGTPTPDASAKLDVSSTTQGVLLPRMTSMQRAAIANPAAGLLVYQTDGVAGYYFYNGSIWNSFRGLSGPQGEPGLIGLPGPQGAAGANGQGLPVAGNAGQVLAKVNATNYNTEWVTPTTTSGGSGATLVWEATALAGQTFNVGVGITDGTGTIRYDNDVTGPLNGATITFDSVFNVSQSGLYTITAQVALRGSGASSFSLGNIAPYIEIYPPSGAPRRRYYGNSMSPASASEATNPFPPSLRGRGFVTATVNLTAGESVRIRVNNLSASVTGVITIDGTSRVTIVKL